MRKSKLNSIETTSEGFITLDRAIMRHWIANDADMFKRWIDIIMMANYKTKLININYQMVECQRGQFITSLSKLAERWKTSRENTRSYIRMLKNAHMIDTETNSHYTQITICNYDTYQLNQHTENTDNHTLNTRKPHTNHTPTYITNNTIIKKENNKYNIILKALKSFLKSKDKKSDYPGGAEQLITDAKLLLTEKLDTESYNQLVTLVLNATNFTDSTPVNITEQPYPQANTILNYYSTTLHQLEKELMQSDEWHIKICMHVQRSFEIEITPEFVKQKIPDFIKLVNEQDDFPVTLAKKKTHFMNWLNKNLKYSGKNEKAGTNGSQQRGKRVTNLTSIADNPDEYGAI